MTANITILNFIQLFQQIHVLTVHLNTYCIEQSRFASQSMQPVMSSTRRSRLTRDEKVNYRGCNMRASRSGKLWSHALRRDGG